MLRVIQRLSRRRDFNGWLEAVVKELVKHGFNQDLIYRKHNQIYDLWHVHKMLPSEAAKILVHRTTQDWNKQRHMSNAPSKPVLVNQQA
jgi:hypothetical protein